MGANSHTWGKYPTFSPRLLEIEPLSGFSNPASNLSSVDFPDPLGPISPTRSPEKRLKEIQSTVKTKLEAYQILSFIMIFLVIASVGFGIYNARSITKDLPPEENRNNAKTE